MDKWAEFLQGLRPHRAAGICSGGEVGFFNLLLHAQREVVLVDHSYKSLYFAMVKYLALQKYGPDVYERITKATTEAEFRALAEEFEDALPPKVRTAFLHRGRYDVHGYLIPSRSPEATGVSAFASRRRDIQDVWSRLPKERVVKSCARLHKVTFLHGDLTDLATKGTFGLLYLSNALEHISGKTRNYPVVQEIEKVVRPGGHVILSHRYNDSIYDKRPGPDHWEQVNEAAIHSQGVAQLRWCYKLYRIPEKVAA
jgi:SAM-dependent methyltransferase